jgi:hypothetical protein
VPRGLPANPKCPMLILPKKHIFNMLCWMSVGIFSIIRSIDESTGV